MACRIQASAKKGKCWPCICQELLSNLNHTYNQGCFKASLPITCRFSWCEWAAPKAWICLHHSMETAVQKIISDALLEADHSEVTLLCSLDLSAAYDMVDHDIFIDRLQTTFGIHGTVLLWISSLHKDRTQTVTFAGTRSNTCAVCHNTAFLVWCYFFYTSSRLLSLLINTVLVHKNSYVDDTHLHIHKKADDLESSIPQLVSCIARMDVS